MGDIKNPFNNDQSIKNIELTLLRAFFLFHLAERLFVLAFTDLHDAGSKFGWW